MSIFANTSQIFENVKVSRIHRHEIENKAIASIIQASARIFRILDHNDAVQADISRRLWVFRSSIVFTILPFDSPGLSLRRQMDEFVHASSGLPDASQFLESLVKGLEDLLMGDFNPKREWLLGTLGEAGDPDEAGIGVFHVLSSGKSPGWPVEAAGELTSQLKKLKFVGSRKNLRSGIFSRLILPCACQNVSPLLLDEIFHSGRASRIDVLLYLGERFHIPQRLILPESSIFKGRLQKTLKEHEVHEAQDENSNDPVDTWVNEAFWQGVHGADRSSGVNLVAAHYVLFCDGTGTFLPRNGRVPIFSEGGDALTNESDLSLVPVENVCEGDLVILRAGDSRLLLDETSDRIMRGIGEDGLVDEATDWKNPLEALLLTLSLEDVAQALQERGIQTSAASIHQWVGPYVLGPGKERTFKELIGLLGDRGKISMMGQDLATYADNRWKSLQELRSVRQQAGNLIRQEMLKALLSQFSSGGERLGDKTSVHIEGDGSAELLILRVSSIDRSPAFVSPSRLCRLDDLRSNRWLG